MSALIPDSDVDRIVAAGAARDVAEYAQQICNRQDTGLYLSARVARGYFALWSEVIALRALHEDPGPTLSDDHAAQPRDAGKGVMNPPADRNPGDDFFRMNGLCPPHGFESQGLALLIEGAEKELRSRAASGNPTSAVAEFALEDAARAEVGRLLGRNGAPTWQDVAEACRPITMKIVPGKEHEIADMLENIRANPARQTILVDDGAVPRVPVSFSGMSYVDPTPGTSPHTIEATTNAVIERAKDIAEVLRLRRNAIGPEVRAIVQAIVELIATGDK